MVSGSVAPFIFANKPFKLTPVISSSPNFSRRSPDKTVSLELLLIWVVAKDEEEKDACIRSFFLKVRPNGRLEKTCMNR
jgi:hypothetical protein